MFLSNFSFTYIQTSCIILSFIWCNKDVNLLMTKYVNDWLCYWWKKHHLGMHYCFADWREIERTKKNTLWWPYFLLHTKDGNQWDHWWVNLFQFPCLRVVEREKEKEKKSYNVNLASHNRRPRVFYCVLACKFFRDLFHCVPLIVIIFNQKDFPENHS
jgi:hypothetical protein